MYRKEYKGTAAKDEKLKLLCDIRHQYTNYDKLAAFYRLYPEKRSLLNIEINNLIKAGPDGISKFRKNVKKIEEYVDLNLKKSKQRFLNEQIVKLRTEHPDYTFSLAEKCAQTILANRIRINNKYIEKRNKRNKHDTNSNG